MDVTLGAAPLNFSGQPKSKDVSRAAHTRVTSKEPATREKKTKTTYIFMQVNNVT